ncbi:MAG: MaoC family dehydratase [Alphaproteobacteria bacterium]|nr:MaoC family dehydratase [Alphaproteobacteria bacterium]MDX5370736.1 MaoC family dehydratase [Alphaproteobacteria bacterium]MDX5465153.1 MaoC family dehydratase [Alphaproteobacteria bacterium]
MADSLTPVSLTVDAGKINLYAEVTDDFNPLHVDPAFAATTPMGGVIAHGTMSLALIWQSLAQTFGDAKTAGAEVEIRFTRPVRIGDTVTAGGEPDPETPGRYRVWVKNQDGQPVIDGWAAI